MNDARHCNNGKYLTFEPAIEKVLTADDVIAMTTLPRADAASTKAEAN